MRTTLVILLLAAALLSAAQRTTRRTRPRPAVEQTARVAGPAADTITVDSLCDRLVRLSGFDKTLASRRESFFVENRSDSADLVWMSLSIDYIDMAGRQLHQRRARVRCSVPPGQTRRVDIPAWDRQNVYYYHGSEPRRRVQAAAAPFLIKMKIDSIAFARP